MPDPSDRPDPSDSSYVVVARRYRPRGFDELVGQEHVGRALKNAIDTNRVGHAYLFTGARGVGKTSTARIFAKALNNPGGPSAAPDNESDVALAIDSGEDVDVIEIDGASNRGIDEIRSLRANVGVRPSRSRFKIYIIDEVHMLTQAAFNALLKTLEEPPEHVKFIFCTTDPEKIPITVLSRCQRFDFAPVEVTKIVGRLREIVTAESAQADDAALELIARRAAGSMRDSQSLLEQVLSFSDGNLNAEQVHAMLGTADDERLHGLAKAMADRDAASALTQMDQAVDAGVDAGRLAEQLLGYFRDLMAISVGCDQSLMRHTSVALSDELKELGDKWGLQTVLAVVGLIDQTLVRIRHSVHGRVLLEASLIQICNLPDLQNIANLAAGAEQVTSTAGPRPASQKKNVVDPANSGPPKPKLTEVPSRAQPDTPSVSPANAPDVTSLAPSSQATGAAVLDAVSTTAVAAPAQNTTAIHNEVPAQATVAPTTVTGTAVEAKTTATAVATGAHDLSAQTAEQIWKLAAQQVEPMTATLALSVKKVELEAGNKLRLMFLADAKMAARRIDMPEHKTAMLAAIQSLCGETVTLETSFLADSSPKPASAPKRQSGKERMQRMRDIEHHPLVKACVEQFDAQVVKVDLPK